jgi:cell division septation protein DedD
MATQNRTTFYPLGYIQAAVVAYFTLEYYIRDSTMGCLLLDKAIMVQGNGDGGFAAPFVGDAFRRFGFQILNIYAAAPPLDLENFLLDSVDIMDAGTANSDTQLRNELFLLAASTPGFVKTGTEFSLLSATVREGIVGALSNNPQGELSAILPAELADILNPDLLELFRNANELRIASPCEGIESEVCTEISQASAWRVLTGEVARLNIPIELCYSTEDTLLSARQFPDEIFADADQDVTTFAGPTGLDQLVPSGDHALSLRLCSLSPMLFYTLNGHRPVAVEDRGDFMPGLDDEQLQACPATRTESVPSPSSPTMPSPTIPSPTMPSPAMPSPTEATPAPSPSPHSAATKKQYTLAATLVGASALMLVL